MPIGIMNLGGSRRQSNAFTIDIQNYDTVKHILDQLEVRLAWDPKKGGAFNRTNSELRQGAREIAKEVIVPQLKRTARSSRTPQAKAVATTAREKSDRLVMVQIGQAIPPLSGFRRYKRSKTKGVGANKRWATQVAWGSELGPHPNAKVNHYRAPRNLNGYWVQPGVTNSIPEAHKRYLDLLNHMLDEYGKYR